MQGALTFSMIKPDAVHANHVGDILAVIEQENFKVRALFMLQLTQKMAQCFYEVHAERPFYNDLCSFISSGPVVAMVLEKENAVQDLRSLMGATNPSEADPGTIRKRFGTSIDCNAIHGSDSVETAAAEVAFFFAHNKLV